MVLTVRYTRCIVHVEAYGDMTGDELQRIRKRLRLTQTGLAERLGVSSNTVARWERDEVPIREPMVRLIRVLAKNSETPRGRREKG